METVQQILPAEQIDFDPENPRIKAWLEKFGDALNEARIRFALRSSMDDGAPASSSFESLKGSIRAAGGIAAPIVVVPKGGRYICIDGNTRVLIYRELEEEGATGNWHSMKAEVLRNASQRDIETIRITAHLVGSREWPAYEKARYLHERRNEQFMDYAELIAICGGSKRQIDEQISAYHDMNKYYRIPNSDEAFKLDRFSGFVELQKRGIKDSIFNAGLELEDFANWIRDGWIFRLADVRKLPKVLEDEEARQIFLGGGLRSIEAAADLVDQKKQTLSGQTRDRTRIGDASLGLLAEALLDKIEKLPRSEFNALRDGIDSAAQETVQALAALVSPLNRLLEDV
ncbi:MAG: hypothetical protein OXG51_04135 [Gammaproteobacteria bacterium]|nr:hypothetical protein [Gammaproteobacteria bacterium]